MQEQLTIVKVIYAPPHLGGSGYMGLLLGRELAKRGHNVHVVSYPGTYLSEDDQRVMTLHPVENITYGAFKVPPMGLILPSAIYQLSRTIPIDVIHAHYAVTHGEAVIDAREIINRAQEHNGLPTNRRVGAVITNHGTDVSVNGCKDLLAPALELRLSQADGISFVAKALQDTAREVFRLDNYGRVIHNFIDPKPYTTTEEYKTGEIKRRYGIHNSKMLFYHTSNLRPIKNVGLLLDAWNTLVNEIGRQDCHLMIIGEGEELHDLEEKVKDCGLSSTVTFTGRIDEKDIPSYTIAGDVLVLPSRKEAMPLVILEAMHAGNAVVASNVGGIGEVVEENESGLLFPENDHDTLVQRMLDLLENPQLIKSMGRKGKAIVQSKFRPEAITQQYEEWYYEALKRRRG
ncbi:glycosyltransferase [Candidatus Woesearchaeota archaeon]|nr:glycosyltransferase [Candidatus Woesearchaeota archaeon]